MNIIILWYYSQGIHEKVIGFCWVCVLEIYQKLELEKKKARIHRQTYSGPVIRYHSVTVPLVEEVAEAEINVDGEAMDWLVESHFKYVIRRF